MKFRVTTAAGVQHELDADDFQTAIEAVVGEGCTPEQITSAWYFSEIYGHWMSGDNLLKSYKAAKNFEE